MMGRILKQLTVGISLGAFVFLTGLTTIVFFPQPLFAYSFTHKNVTVYADEEIDPEIKSILDNSYLLIKECELYDPNFHFNIFFAHNNIFNKIEDLLGKGPIARATAGNVIFKVPADIGNNTIMTTRSRIDLTEILAHEMVHLLQTHKYGMLVFSPFKHPPLWKLEGYPEYVSRQSLRSSGTYDLRNEIKRFVRLNETTEDNSMEATPGHFMPSHYFKGRIMMEYLIEIKGHSYDEVLTDAFDENSVTEEMVRWSEDS